MNLLQNSNAQIKRKLESCYFLALGFLSSVLEKRCSSKITLLNLEMCIGVSFKDHLHLKSVFEDLFY